jgi:hypothetical protein
MRHLRATVLGVAVSFLMGLVGCAGDAMKAASETPQAPRWRRT